LRLRPRGSARRLELLREERDEDEDEDDDEQDPPSEAEVRLSEPMPGMGFKPTLRQSDQDRPWQLIGDGSSAATFRLAPPPRAASRGGGEKTEG